jgi:hemolysin D
MRKNSDSAASLKLSKSKPSQNQTTDELQFLPALLEVIETPPSPYGRWLLWLLLTFVTIAFIWSFLGQVEIVAVASGKVIPAGRSRVIQPLESGIIRKIFVAEGQLVRSGDALVELDTSIQQADIGRNLEALASAKLEVKRQKILIDAIQGRVVSNLAVGIEAPKSLISTQQDALEGELNGFRARQLEIDAEIKKKYAELQSGQELVRKLTLTLPIAEGRADDLRRLRESGFVSEHGMLDREQIRIELERDLAYQKSKMKEIDASISESRRRLNTHESEAIRNAKSALAEAQKRVGQFEWEVSKNERVRKQSKLVAPIDGTVQQLSINTETAVVTPAQTLMLLVPLHSALEVEAILQNKDVGFVRVGDHVGIKLTPFPYVRHGLLVGRVTNVSRDAVIDTKGEANFSVRVAVNQALNNSESEKLLFKSLEAGMSVTAEIKTGTRRIIDFVLDPVVNVAREGLRER